MKDAASLCSFSTQTDGPDLSTTFEPHSMTNRTSSLPKHGTYLATRSQHIKVQYRSVRYTGPAFNHQLIASSQHIGQKVHYSVTQMSASVKSIRLIYAPNLGRWSWIVSPRATPATVIPNPNTGSLGDCTFYNCTCVTEWIICACVWGSWDGGKKIIAG